MILYNNTNNNNNTKNNIIVVKFKLNVMFYLPTIFTIRMRTWIVFIIG